MSKPVIYAVVPYSHPRALDILAAKTVKAMERGYFPIGMIAMPMVPKKKKKMEPSIVCMFVQADAAPDMVGAEPDADAAGNGNIEDGIPMDPTNKDSETDDLGEGEVIQPE